jgi:hypothetical protein
MSAFGSDSAPAGSPLTLHRNNHPDRAGGQLIGTERQEVRGLRRRKNGPEGQDRRAMRTFTGATTQAKIDRTSASSSDNIQNNQDGRP